MTNRKPSADEEKAIRIAFKLDPRIWIGKPFCKAAHSSCSWCTRPENHPGPHICTIHANDRVNGIPLYPNLHVIWYDERDGEKND